MANMSFTHNQNFQQSIMLAEEQKVKQAFYDAAFGYHLDANGNLETTPGRKSNSKMFTPKEHEDIIHIVKNWNCPVIGDLTRQAFRQKHSTNGYRYASAFDVVDSNNGTSTLLKL